MDMNTLDGFRRRQSGGGIVIALAAGDHVNFPALPGQMEGQIAEQLTGSGMVGMKIAVGEDDLHARITSLRAACSPRFVAAPSSELSRGNTSRYEVSGAILFGGRARHTHRPDSEVDIVVALLHGPRGEYEDAALDMAGIAFDVPLETGVLVAVLPLWEDEWEHPERFSNPILIENIRREGMRL